jgi:hypothetical protein
MSAPKIEYPIHKHDNLGRIVYSQWSEYVRVANKYYGATDKVKIKYRFFGNDVAFDAYDQSGTIIMSYSKGNFEFMVANIKLSHNEISFKMARPMVRKCLSIIKSRQSKKVATEMHHYNDVFRRLRGEM